LSVCGREFVWGTRTFLMGIVNVTPDSFSGDGLLAGGAGATEAAVTQVRRMVAEGVDIVDVGVESTRPGHAPVYAAEERDRVVPVIAAIRQAFPGLPVSVDTTKAEVAVAALDAGADVVNDVWGTAPDAALIALVAARAVPYVLMHNRAEPIYGDVVADVVADLADAVERAVDGGVARERILIDPGIGFGKTAEHNLVLLARLDALRSLGRPILLGTSRKSTIGRVLDLPPDQRLEGTLATTALGVAGGVDIVRVHDVQANRRAARVADAIVRGAATLAAPR
jgi:dihydropteroate synthase